MSFWAAIWNKLKEILNKMVGNRAVENKLNITPAISNKMLDAIDLWSKMYVDESPWLHKATISEPVNIVSLGLPAMIASEKARTATLEMRSEITVPVRKDEIDNPEYTPPTKDEFGNDIISRAPKTIINEIPTSPVERADYLNSQYQEKLLPKIRTQLEYGIAKGGLIIKPYVIFPKSTDGNPAQPQFAFDFIQADGFYPIAFNSSGSIIECVFVQHRQDRNTVYTRLEHHKLENTSVIVRNFAFKANNSSRTTESSVDISDLGKEIPLTDVPEWSDLHAEIKIDNVDRLLFGYFKMPDANTIDPKSPLGVSGFSRAVSNIEQADLQYSRLLWEYEAGEMAIDIDRDALAVKEDVDGTLRYVPNVLQERLYRKVDLGESNTYMPFAPALRDNSYANGLNTILMKIEDQCAISRGTLSDPAYEARTATELKILKQRSYIANYHTQQALQKALEDVVYVMDIYCTLYDIVGDTSITDAGSINIGKYEVSFEWDDSILVDSNEELTTRLLLLQNGLASKVELRMWYFGETEQQAMDALAKIQDESVDDVVMGLGQ